MVYMKKEMDHITIGVVIPFFQRDAEILPRCLKSVFAQQAPNNIQYVIVIVDDESPLPIDEAISQLVVPERYQIICLKQQNGGPGAARNTALRHLANYNIDFVAFIDSDDTWKSDHIALGLSTLGDDGDFYFCDHDRWDYSRSYLEDSKNFQAWIAATESCLFIIDQSFDKKLDLGIKTFEFYPSEAFYAFIEDYLAQTSTVIFRYKVGATVRFDPNLRYAGEDNMFWLDLAKLSRAVRVCTARNVVTGIGVNMFASTMSWSHPKAAQRTAAQVIFFLAIRRKFGIDNRVQSIVNERLNFHEAEFSEVWIRTFLKNPLEALRVIRNIVIESPAIIWRIPMHVVKGTARK